MTDDRLAAAERGWFGYGRWEAPFWFLGLEQGGSDEPGRESYHAWVKLGGAALLDCRSHHLTVGTPPFLRWHTGTQPPTQSTWRALIQILLGYLQQPADLQSVRDYQCNQWGSITGQTAVLELSGTRAKSLNVKVDRTRFKLDRIATLRKMLLVHQPEFLVCYGITAKPDFEQVVGTSFDADGYAVCGTTLCVLVRHPVARGPGGEKVWQTIGQAIKARRATMIIQPD